MHRFAFLLATTAMGCGDKDDTDTDTGPSTPDTVDADGDGFSEAVDCDDTDASVGAAMTMYADGDGDGYGDEASSAVVCPNEAGYAALAGDCDDAAADVNPGAEELCDGVDNDCNGLDDGSDAPTWYLDNDGDGYGGELYTMVVCDQPEGAWFDTAADCNDLSADDSPAGVEVCDGMDNDCDGSTDEEDAIDPATWYEDADGDGYGNAESTTDACDAPSGFVDNAEDCDDADTAQPGLLYHDADHDGYGSATADPVAWCGETPDGYSDNADDCDDTNATVNPDGVEVCDEDNLDEDCNGVADDADSASTGQQTWYPDVDGDGYGDGDGTTVTACDEPSGYSLDGTDCDDNDTVAAGGGVEICDGLDNDCDGVADWDMNVPNDYATIGDAIAAASDGDTICLAAGTYTELVDFGGLSLSIEGYDGSGSTIIDGDGDGPVVSAYSGETASLSGVTITGGEYLVGAGLYVDNADMTLDDVVIDDNSCTETEDYCYGVVYTNEAALTFSDVDVTNNYVSNATSSTYDYNYGMTLFIDSTVDWQTGSISDNLMEGSGSSTYNYNYGGAIYAQDSVLSLNAVDITDNTTESTDASYDYIYGMLYLYSSELDFSEGELSGNSNTGDYYAYHFISSYYGSVINMTDVDFTDNELMSVGSSTCYAYYFLYNYYSEFYGDNVLIANNTQQANCGSTAYAYYNLYNYYGTFELTDSDWSSNRQEAISSGGTAYAYYRAYNYYGKLSFDQVRYADNTQDANSTSGSAYAYYGFYSSNGRLDWTNVIFSGNEKTATASSSAYAYYGFMYNSSSTVNIENVDFVGNSSTADTVYTGIFYDSSGGDTNVSNTTFANNTITATTGYANIYYSSYAQTSSSVGAFDMAYSDTYNNTGFADDFAWSGGATATYTGTNGNISADPLYTDTSSTDSVDWDLELSSSSTLIDAGDPSILDVDGSTSDIGAYGGPGGTW